VNRRESSSRRDADATVLSDLARRCELDATRITLHSLASVHETLSRLTNLSNKPLDDKLLIRPTSVYTETRGVYTITELMSIESSQHSHTVIVVILSFPSFAVRVTKLLLC